MFTKKSCVNCAFCLHCRDIFYGFSKSDWNYKKDNLTEEEISQLEKGDISFLSEAKRKREEWIATYEKRKEEKDKEQYRKRIEACRRLQNNPLDKLLGKDFLNIGLGITEKPPIVPLLNGDPYPRREEFGMEPCPVVPDHEYLECWKEIWGKPDEDIWTTLKSKKCRNYYPLSKKETKSLEACDEERKERVDNKKYWRGVVVGFISAFSVMILRFVLMPYFTATSNNNSSYPTQVEQQNVVEETLTETQNNNVSDSNIQIEIKQDTVENTESEE